MFPKQGCNLVGPLSEQQLADLRAWPSPAIVKPIETFDLRSHDGGFMGPEIVCRFPELPPIVDYRYRPPEQRQYPRSQSTAFVNGRP